MSVRKHLADTARRLLHAAGVRSVTRTVRGSSLRIPIAIGELRSMLFDRNYAPFFNEDEVMDVLAARLRPEDIVFDIGAYHGVWAMLLARSVREVVAFEPNPGTFAVLEQMIAVNRADNVTAYRVAIGGEASVADFWGTGSGASLREGGNRMARNRVSVETLDGFAARRQRLPDVIKIDVEGAEHEVLRGARQCLAHARVLCVEVHFDELPKFDADYRRVESLVSGAGFVEVVRSQPTRLGADDPSRCHVIWEKPTGGLA